MKTGVEGALPTETPFSASQCKGLSEANAVDFVHPIKTPTGRRVRACVSVASGSPLKKARGQEPRRVTDTTCYFNNLGSREVHTAGPPRPLCGLSTSSRCRPPVLRVTKPVYAESALLYENTGGVTACYSHLEVATYEAP